MKRYSIFWRYKDPKDDIHYVLDFWTLKGASRVLDRLQTNTHPNAEWYIYRKDIGRLFLEVR